MQKRIITWLALCFTFVLIVATVSAQIGGQETAVPVDGIPQNNPAPVVFSETGVYLLQLKEPPVATYRGHLPGLPATSLAVTGGRRVDAGSPASQAYRAYLARQQDRAVNRMEARIGRSLDVAHRYNIIFNGIAVTLTSSEVAGIAGLPDVARIFAEEIHYPVTDYGPAWIGAPDIWDGSATGGQPGNQGEGIIIGVIDTGINTDHPSFAAVGPVDGYVHSNPLPGYVGLCVSTPALCNDKLIGLWDYADAFGESDGAEDSDGHGSHTASTSAGNVVNASLSTPTTYTYDAVISGVAPHANIIAYDVCTDGCPTAATLDAIEQAMLDGVDVVNYSISGGDDPYNDAMEIAFLNARAMGVFVAASAGNAGPGATTVAHRSPWVTTVAASTHNRHLVNALINMSGGNTTPPADMQGVSITPGLGSSPIVYAGDFGNALCAQGSPDSPTNPFTPGTFTGMIVVCDRGTYARVVKGQFVAEAGAVGYVLANDEANGDGLTADPHYLPAVHITYDDGVVLKNWIAAGGSPMAEIAGTTADLGAANGDITASFSSRGPNTALPDLIKPDITAPGVDIFAAYRDGEEYNIISGTSMSSPHIAGSAALIMALHPNWTPAQVQSAMMMTSHPDVLKEDGVTAADPFDMGAGRIDLSRAGLTGLVLDESISNYWAAHPVTGTIGMKDLNVASLADATCDGTCSWTRTFSSTLPTTTQWTVSFDAPDGIALSTDLTGSQFMIGAGGLQSFTITADLTDFNAALNGNEDGWAFATMNLAASGQESLHVPIAVRKAYSSNEALLGKTPDDLTVLPGQFVTYTIHLENHDEVTNTYQITDTLPAGLTFVPGSATINGVPGGLVHNSGVLTWSGDLGPGAMDYVVTDVTGQVSYVNWADLSNTPEEICATYFPGDCDNAPIVFPLEGTFTYYRDELEDIIVNSDGYLHGLDGWLGSAYLPFNHHFPDTTELNQVIAGLWRNMDMTSAASELYAGVTNEVLPSGDQTFYASWDSAPRFTGFEGGPNVITSHGIALVLDGAGQTEPAGRIYFLYGTINGNLDLYGYTVGVENKTGTQGTTYAFDQCNFQVGDPILCIPHASVGSAPTSNMALRLDPVTLSENYFVTLTYQAEVTEATPGAVLTNNVEITSDSPDPDAQLMTAKADVTVTGVIGTPPTAEFASNSPVALGNQTVFTNQTTGDTPITYQWDFGDSSAINTTENPTHTYGAADTYTVVLTATNAFGSDSVMHQVVVGEPPAADFTSNSPQATGAPVQYTNGTTGDGTLSYAWNFGDGSGISTAVNPTHAYSAAATYTVILTATSEFGTDAISHPVEIGDPPAADFTSNSPVTVGTQAVFTNTTTGSDAISYEWDFGDGSSSTAENPVHDYVAPDIYTVVMTATSVFGIDATSHSFVVNEDTSGAPVAGFIFEGSGRVGDPIQFTSTSTGQAPLNHEWDFGDGNSSMEANPTHIYTGAGDYIVTLTVTNDIDSDETTDTVIIRYYLFVPLVISDDS